MHARPEPDRRQHAKADPPHGKEDRGLDLSEDGGVRAVSGSADEEEREDTADREHDAGAAAVDGEGAGPEEGGENLAEEAQSLEGPLQQGDVCSCGGKALLCAKEEQGEALSVLPSPPRTQWRAVG